MAEIDLDGVDLLGGADEDQTNEDIGRIKRAVANERSCPELLPYEGTLVNDLQEMVQQQQLHIDEARDLSAVAEVAPDHARRVWRSGRPCGRISGHPSMRHRRARPDRATHRRRGHRCCHVSRDAISAALGPMSGRAVRPSRLKRGGQTGWATGVGRNRTT